MDWAYAHALTMKSSAGGPHLRPVSPLLGNGRENVEDEEKEDTDEEGEGEENADEDENGENEEEENEEGGNEEGGNEETEGGGGGANEALEGWLAAGSNSATPLSSTTVSTESDQQSAKWHGSSCFPDCYCAVGPDSKTLDNKKASPGWRKMHSSILPSLLYLAIFADKYSVTQLRDDILTALFIYSFHWNAFPAASPSLTKVAYENLPASSQFLKFLAYSTAYTWNTSAFVDNYEQETEVMRLHHPGFWLQVSKVLAQRINGSLPWEASRGLPDSCRFHEHEERDMSECMDRIRDPSVVRMVFELLAMNSVEAEAESETKNKLKHWKTAIAKWRRHDLRASSVSGRSVSGRSDLSRFPFEFRPWVVRFANRLPSLRGKRKRKVRRS